MLYKHRNGFSLLELLICMMIVAVLASIAYPTYTHHIARSYRRQAQLTLMRIANTLEQQHAESQTYTNIAINHYIDHALTKQYRITPSKVDDNYFQLLAIPVNAQAQRDEQCGMISLDSNGKRGSNGSLNWQDCWK